MVRQSLAPAPAVGDLDGTWRRLVTRFTLLRPTITHPTYIADSGLMYVIPCEPATLLPRLSISSRGCLVSTALFSSS